MRYLIIPKHRSSVSANIDLLSLDQDSRKEQYETLVAQRRGGIDIGKEQLSNFCG